MDGAVTCVRVPYLREVSPVLNFIMSLCVLQRLLDLGGNGWRTAHNPVDPTLLAETDRRGVIVWSEARFLRKWSNYVQDAQDSECGHRQRDSS